MTQVVITSYEMMTNLTCAACCMGTAAFKKDSKCTGADHCMAAHGFKVHGLKIQASLGTALKLSHMSVGKHASRTEDGIDGPRPTVMCSVFSLSGSVLEGGLEQKPHIPQSTTLRRTPLCRCLKQSP